MGTCGKTKREKEKMKTQEQVQAALKKYQQLLDENQRIVDFEEAFLKASSFMDNKEAHIIAAVKYYQASKAVASCERLIKNCKWILDIE